MEVTNRFKGLNVIDRVPEDLWMEVHDFIQEAEIKTIPKKKKCKKAKWLSEEDLQIAEKTRKAKGKGEKERYTHLNAELQRIARRDKQVFLSDQQTVQFSSVAQSCPTLCNIMNCSTPGLPVHHQLPEFTQIHVHLVSDAIQPSHPRSSPSPPAPNLSQHQSLFQ